jgi:hypothetical protein
MTQQAIAISLGGGLDLVTPEQTKKPGCVIAALNYEPLSNGYGRLKGYERFNGRTAPSAVVLLSLNYTGGSQNMTGLGLEINADIANGTFVVVKQVVSSGSYGAGTAAGYMIIIMVNPGVIANGDTLDIDTGVSTTTVATATGPASTTIPVAEDAAALLISGREQYRGNISIVDGTGPVRGVWYYKGDIYAIRNLASGTGTAVLYKATPTGWSQASLGLLVTINFLQHQINAGDVITGATSGATATIYYTSLNVQTGAAAAWTSNVAGTVANLQVRSGDSTGTFTSGENITVGGVVVGKIYTSFGPYPKAYLFGDDGNYQFINYDFGSGTKIYWASGNDFAYEFDGTNPPIAIGVGLTFATRIAVYNNALFISGGITDVNSNHLYVSVIGNPTNINDATLGAVELSLGSNIVDMVNVPNGLVILCENHVYLLAGNDYTDYQLSTINDTSGALYYTAHRFGNVIYMDNSGLRTLTSGTLGYGNSPAQTISRLISPYLVAKRVAGVSPTTSFLCRSNSQYWLFFDDGTGIIVYLEGKSPAAMTINLGVTVFCASSVEVNGVERIFLGATNGFVYELNKGTSFDGSAIEHYIRLPFNSFGSPMVLKRAHKALFDIIGNPTISASVDFDYGSTQGIAAQTVQLTAGDTAIASLGTNEAWFDQQIETRGEVYIDGVAKNFSLKISGSTVNETAHVLTSVTYMVTARGLQR